VRAAIRGVAASRSPRDGQRLRPRRRHGTTRRAGRACSPPRTRRL